MSTLDNINSRLGEIDAEIETLDSLTDPTPEDAARAEALATEAAELRTKRLEVVAVRERIAETAAKARIEKGTSAGFQFMQRVDPYGDDLRMFTPEQTVDAARSILDRPEARHVAPAAAAKAEGLVGKYGERLAAHVIATSRPEYRSAFLKYLGGKEMLLSNDERRAVAAAERTAWSTSDSAGGYAIPFLLDPSVIFSGNGSTNPFRAISRVVTGVSDIWNGVTSAGISGSWDNEAAEVSDDGPAIGNVAITAKKGQAFVPYSFEIEADWVSMGAELTELFMEAKDSMEATAFATGSAPIGVVTALVAGSGTVANVAPGTDGELYAADLYNLFATLPPRYRSNASWVMSLDMQNQVRTLGDDKLSNQTVDLTAGYNFQLLGRPVYESSAMDSFTGTTGVANLAVVGDFRHYIIYDRIGARVEVVPHLFATNANLPNGQRGALMWWRTGADVAVDNAFRLLRNA